MTKIVIQKGLSKVQEIQGNGSVGEVLKQNIPDLNIQNCMILKDGEQVPLDYTPKADEIIYCREVPGATACAIVGLVCAAVSLGMAVYSAVQQQELQKEMEKAQKQATDLAQKVNQLPFLKGASNQSALGHNIPFIMGSVFDTPYTLTNGFYSIDGTDGVNQFWNAILICGYDNCLINNVSIGNTRIVGYNKYIDVPKLDGTTERVYYMKESDDPYKFHSGSYYDQHNRIEIRSTDEMVIPGLDCKVTGQQYGEEIKHEFEDNTEYLDGIIKQCEENTYKVEVCVQFNGLRYYKKSWKAKKVELKFYWANNVDEGNPNWQLFDTLNIERNSNKTLRFAVTKTFSAAQCFGKSISIKVVRTTAKNETNSQEDCYLAYINCWQYDAWKSSKTSVVPCRPVELPWRDKLLRIGLKIISNDSTKDTLDEINCMAYGTARIWNGSAWTSKRYPTRNPAAWVLEVMTSAAHPHSRYADSEIDLESLGAVFEYCDKNELFCDGIVTEDTKKSDLLNQILTECNTTMYIDSTSGKWVFAIEQEQTTPVALLNDQSIKSVTVSKSFERKPYAQKITFTDRTNWSINTVYISKDNKTDSQTLYNDERTITETACKYITTYKHAFKYAKRIIAHQELQPREVTVQVGREGDFYPLYSMVLLQMRRLSIGLSSGVIHGIRAESGKLTHIQTSDICDFSDTAKRYGLIIQASNNSAKQTLFAEVKGTGLTRVLELVTPISFDIEPEYGNIYSFGYLDSNGKFESVTNKMMIYGSKPNSTGWDLTLKDYSTSLFATGTIPEYVPNLTTPKEIGTKIPVPTYGDIQSAVGDAMEILQEQEGLPPANLTSIKALATEKGIEFTAVNNSYNLSNSLQTVRYELSKDDGETWEVVNTAGTTATYYFDRTTDGYPERQSLLLWRARAKAVNVYGLESEEYTESLVDLSEYKTWIPASPKVTVNVSKRSATLLFEPLGDCYGRTEYGVTITRPDTDEGIYYTPGIALDPYASEQNYKAETTTPIFVAATFKQGLPLKGQNKTIWILNEYKYLEDSPDEHYGNKRTYLSQNPAPEDATEEKGVYTWSNTSGTETTVYTATENSSPNPEDTIYLYKYFAKNIESGNTSEESTVQAIADANGIGDIADRAITQAKLDDQAVTAEKIAVGSISAEKIAAGNILSKGVTAGAMTTDGLTVSGSGFWASENMSYPYTDHVTGEALTYGADRGEFFVGNTPIVYGDEDETDRANAAEYLHFKPGEGFYLRIKNFVIRGLQTLITGIFKVRGGSGNTDLLVVNATDTLDEESGVAARTVKIDGSLTTTGAINGTAAIANKLGTADLGNANKPIYLKAGTATLCNELCNLTGAQTLSGAKTFSGTVNANGVLKIPTAAPSSPVNGNIWLA